MVAIPALAAVCAVAFEPSIVSSSFRAERVPASIFLLLSYAAIEELICRRTLLELLDTGAWGSRLAALIIQAIVFALLHGKSARIDAGAFGELFLAGLLLGALYVLTGGIALSVMAHAWMNLYLCLFDRTKLWFAGPLFEHTPSYIPPLVLAAKLLALLLFAHGLFRMDHQWRVMQRLGK